MDNEKVKAAELLVNKMKDDDYIDFRGDHVALDGGFSIEELEACIIILKALQARSE